MEKVKRTPASLKTMVETFGMEIPVSYTHLQVSQVPVSRLERRSLQKLRDLLAEE